MDKSNFATIANPLSGEVMKSLRNEIRKFLFGSVLYTSLL